MTAFVALSNSVSPRPNTSVPTNSAQRLRLPEAPRMASHSATLPRITFANAMT
jgi:hypothetical protein